MPQTLHISVPDNLHGELLKLADADFKKLGEYCKDILIKHVKEAIEKSAPKPEPKQPGRKRSERSEKLAREIELRKERKLYGGNTIDEWIEYYSGPYEKLDWDNRDYAHENLQTWLECKSRIDGIPLAELQAKYKAQKPKPKNVHKPMPANAVMTPKELDDLLESLNDEGEE